MKSSAYEPGLRELAVSKLLEGRIMSINLNYIAWENRLK